MGLIVVPILFIYLIIAVVVTYKVGRLPKTWSKKLLVSLASMFVFVGLIAGDSIVGRIYLQHICAKDGGLIFNKSVEVSPKYFDVKGGFQANSRKLLSDEGVLIEGRYLTKIKDLRFGINNKMRKLIYEVVDTENNQLIAQSIQYSYGGGWFENINLGTKIQCPIYKPNENVLRMVFKMKEIDI